MAAGVCLIFLIPYCAEPKYNSDEDMNILAKKPNNDLQENGKQDIDFEIVKSQKSKETMTSDRTESQVFSHRTRFCIFPCLPVRSRSGIEEGKYCKEKEEQDRNSLEKDENINMIEKMSVI